MFPVFCYNIQYSRMITDHNLKFGLHEYSYIAIFEIFRTTFKMIMFNITLPPFQKIWMILK